METDKGEGKALTRCKSPRQLARAGQQLCGGVFKLEGAGQRAWGDTGCGYWLEWETQEPCIFVLSLLPLPRLTPCYCQWPVLLLLSLFRLISPLYIPSDATRINFSNMLNRLFMLWQYSLLNPLCLVHSR